ncbi:MAG: 3-isopropylmalate dehydratase small subunit [Verrucomicrobia bacterium]|jgi:3-isopropylmalate/(R)-2-methylmalate dehydratase small subunit|nr:3-isopropylmalate dehydratase small subunit [Verrucomicrobiota bacterium]
MSLEKITQISGRGVFVPGDDIDTDRIIPARFMKCVTFDGLGEFAFADAKLAEKAAGRLHALDDSRFNGATILISGSNFGCGSSREHAPQALYRYGFRAIIAESFAEIFFGNSTTLGIPCVKMSKNDIADLAALIEKNPSIQVTIDLTESKVTTDDVDFAAEFSLPGHAREPLMNGRWDSIADLVDGLEDVKARVAAIPYLATK